jgi:hypothetical protein
VHFSKKKSIRLCQVAFCYLPELVHVLIASILAVWSAYHLIADRIADISAVRVVPKLGIGGRLAAPPLPLHRT